MRNRRSGTVLYRLRCRLGARLLREHVAASLESLDDAKITHPENRQRIDYMSIGLKKAIGHGGWRCFDDYPARKSQQAVREQARHAA
jgi:hypothetical protein